jgi:hypothetical protein
MLFPIMSNDFLFHSIRSHGGEVIFLDTICGWLSISSASELRLLISLRRYLSLDGHNQYRLLLLLDGALDIRDLGEDLP